MGNGFRFSSDVIEVLPFPCMVINRHAVIPPADDDLRKVGYTFWSVLKKGNPFSHGLINDHFSSLFHKLPLQGIECID